MWSRRSVSVIICITYCYKLKEKNLPEQMKSLIISKEPNNSESASDMDDDNI